MQGQQLKEEVQKGYNIMTVKNHDHSVVDTSIVDHIAGVTFNETKHKVKFAGGANINVHVFKAVNPNGKAVESNVVDPFIKLYGGGMTQTGESGLMIIEPPYNLATLAQMPTISNMTQRCIESYITNIESFGYQFTKAASVADDVAESPEMKTEAAALHSLFDFCNADQSFTMLRGSLRRDVESTGNAYMEVVRTRIGSIAELHRLPAYSCRLTTTDSDATPFTQQVRNQDGVYEEKQRVKKFRRYVQFYGYGQAIYFKEFGDPRPISRIDGKVDKSAPQASELIHFKNETCYGHYGLPRYIPAFLAIMGSRKAEEVNLLFFDNKTIPPMVICVSGGSLTTESMDMIVDTFEKELKGIDNFHKTLVIEAVPHSGSVIEGEKLSPVKIDIKPLTQHIQKDATFQLYRKENADDIRKNYRLPPILVGASDDYSRATALESIKVAENQVFGSLRREFDGVINRNIFADMQINTLDFESIGVKMSDSIELLKAIGAVKEAAPIGTIMDAIQDALGLPKLQIDEELYKIPMSMLPRIGAMFGVPELPTPNFGNGDDDAKKKPKDKKGDDKDDIKKQETTFMLPADASDEDILAMVKNLYRVRKILAEKLKVQVGE